MKHPAPADQYRSGYRDGYARRGVRPHGTHNRAAYLKGYRAGSADRRAMAVAPGRH